MERDVALDLLHRLVNVTIQHCHRTEFLQVRQCLRAIICSPAPLRVYGPQRDVCEHHDRRAVLQMLDVIFHPLQLLVAQRAESSRLQIQDVYQPDEVHPFLVEAVPPCSPCTSESPAGQFRRGCDRAEVHLFSSWTSLLSLFTVTFTPSLQSARAVRQGGAGLMGVARAAIERTCVHPDSGSAFVIPNSSAFLSLLAFGSQQNRRRE